MAGSNSKALLRFTLSRVSCMERIALNGLASAEHLTIYSLDEFTFQPAAEAMRAELMNLRFFAGMANHQAARLLGLSERTAKRNWAYARACLAKEIARLKAGEPRSQRPL